MAYSRATPEQRNEFIRLVSEQGLTIEQAAERVGYSRQWGQKVWSKVKSEGGVTFEGKRVGGDKGVGLVKKYEPDIPDALTRPLDIWELSDVSRDCLEDFGRFRARFFGRRSSPWQEDAANITKDKLLTPHKEYGVVNCPPGSGKSTLFTHDIPAWISTRDRTLRGFIGSSTQQLATSYVGRLRNTFSRTIPVEAKSEEKRLGLAYDAVSSLPIDYGIFKPERNSGAPWTNSQFTLAQPGETPISEKEATYTAFGKDTGFLGWRVNFIVWDDLVRRQDFIGDNKLTKLEADRAWWDDEAETRLEPGGVLILQGQRLGPEDLYRYNLDKKTYANPDAEYFDYGEEELPTEQKYFHVKYKAHHEEVCKFADDPKQHSRMGMPYDPKDPEGGGCLLDPLRLPMRELATIKNRPNSNFETVYQQGDVDPTNVLIPKVFIDGGLHDGEEYEGCWDLDRDPGVLPRFAQRPPIVHSIVTADPSPTKFWSVQWWIYTQQPHQEHLMGTRYLIDQAFKPMGATDLLDYDVDTADWTGLLVEWELRARRLGLPIQHLVIEANAAQKFIAQYKWFKTWLKDHSIRHRSHTTHINKLDPKMGVTTIKNHYRFGRVRLPGTPAGQLVAKPLYDQVTNYPDHSYDDAVMGHWFFEYQLQYILKPKRRLPVLSEIPSWMNRNPSYA